MIRRRAAFAIALVIPLAVPGSAQIPESARWEITFAEVEQGAGLADLRSVSRETVEARVMERPWSAMGQLRFLRLVQTDHTVRAQLFVFWNPHLTPPDRQPHGPDVVCRDRVCVRPVEMQERHDWGEVIAALVSRDACPPPGLGACADCEVLWIKTAARGTYREQECSQPAPDTLAGSLLQLMKRAAR